MQTKPLIHCADAKGIMIKLMLCVIAVLSLTMFIPQEVEAGSCDHCTCDPNGDYAEDRAWWSEGDYSWACGSREEGDACEFNCGGHEYPEGGVNNIPSPYGWVAIYEEWDYDKNFLCYHSRWKHLKIYSKCSLCGQLIGKEEEIRLSEWYEHDLDERHNWVRDIKDPCKVLDVVEIYCRVCHPYEEHQGDPLLRGENFLGWSHLNYPAGYGIDGNANSVTLRDCCAGHEPDIAAITHINDNNVHALWCDCHGYVNRENCSNEEGRVTDDLGEYAGDLFYGTPTNVHEDMSNPNGLRQDGALHVYKHRYTYNGDIIKCNLCIHQKNVGDAILIARRTDNGNVVGGNVVGLSDYDYSWDIGSWINSDVYFQHKRPPDEFNGNVRDIWQSWKLVIDGISGGLRDLTQEGTHYPIYANEKYRRDIYREYVHHYEHWSYKDKDGNTHSGSTPVYRWKWFLGEGGYPERSTIPFPLKIDKTAPKSTPTVTTGAYKTPISKLENEDGTYNSEAYGMKISLNADDSNPKARGGKTDVAKIFAAYVEVIPVDGDGRQVTNLQKTYDLGLNRNGVVTADQGVRWLINNNGEGVLTINTTNVIDVNKDFPEYLDFHYKIHVVDCAGNDAVTEGDIVRQPEVFTNIKNISNNKELRKTNSFIGGEHGVLTIITTGYVDDSTLNWNEFTLGASECDRSHEYPTMVYNQILQMKPYTTETSGFRLAQKGEYYPLLEPMASYTPDGGYTRIYEFVFWTPFNHGWQDEDGSMPYKSPTDQYSVKTVGWNKRYNRVCDAKTYYKIGADKITDKFRTSLVF